MRISSADRESHIDIEPDTDDRSPIFSVSARIQGFTATNPSVALCDVAGFLARLKDFERTRSGEVILEGGERFELRLRSGAATGRLWVGIRIVRHVYLPGPSMGDPLEFRGGFEFDPEYAAELFSDLRRLLRTA